KPDSPRPPRTPRPPRKTNSRFFFLAFLASLALLAVKLEPMKPDRRKIRLTFPATGEAAIAEMLDDEAPAVCEYVWSILPVEHRLFHGMYSGAEVFALLDQAKQLPPENICQLPLPGEILW